MNTDNCARDTCFVFLDPYKDSKTIIISITKNKKTEIQRDSVTFTGE